MYEHRIERCIIRSDIKRQFFSGPTFTIDGYYGDVRVATLRIIDSVYYIYVSGLCAKHR